METLIQRLAKSLEKEGLKVGSFKAQTWLREKTKSLAVNRKSLMKNSDQTRGGVLTGRMFHFFYDPKLKKTLPYYDRFPLTIPIKFYDDGFLGINLHYLSPKMRIAFLNKLSEYINNTKYDQSTKFRISYAFLTKASELSEFQPCLKRYLGDHVQSQFLEIEPNEWDIACLLPSEYFAKKSQTMVWHHSKEWV